METPHSEANAGLWGGRLLTFLSLPSTNQWALTHAESCAHGDVIRAVTQTAGRGRLGRTWESPGDRELTMSVVLKGQYCPQAIAPLLGPATALGIRGMLADAGVPATVKWPNDVMAGGAKIAGILIEHNLRADRYVLGIGINVNVTQSEFDDMELLAPATSMWLSTQRAHAPDTVLATLLPFLDTALSAAMSDLRLEIGSAWASHDYLRDRQIRINTPGGIIAGAYRGMTAEGALRLTDRAGREHTVLSGDASLRDASHDA